MSDRDRSHDPARRSWVESAQGHAEFPVQNLALAAIRDPGTRGELVVAIGDLALSLPGALDAGWGSELAEPLRATLRAGELNGLAARAPAEWTEVRLALSDALADESWAGRLGPALRPQPGLPFRLPFHIHDYTDFYASIHHATNVGSMFRPDNPLLPNYKWVPIGYHGRSSSLVVSGTAIRRPRGQTRPPEATEPVFGPSRSLDYELELGAFVGGRNALGESVAPADAASRLFGFTLLNDWSARDVQAWEYQPLGPFLAKNFASTISPWVVTADALRPFLVEPPSRPVGDPAPLPHLRVPGDRTLALELTVSLQSSGMREAGLPPARISSVEFATAMYWTPAQLLLHHASNGCNLNPGDLLGSGTISGTTPESRGCLLERTWRGAEPLSLPDGEQRRFLEDGDEVFLAGHAHAPGAVSIGFGPCSGRILPA